MAWGACTAAAAALLLLLLLAAAAAGGNGGVHCLDLDLDLEEGRRHHLSRRALQGRQRRHHLRSSKFLPSSPAFRLPAPFLRCSWMEEEEGWGRVGVGHQKDSASPSQRTYAHASVASSNGNNLPLFITIDCFLFSVKRHRFSLCSLPFCKWVVFGNRASANNVRRRRRRRRRKELKWKATRARLAMEMVGLQEEWQCDFHGVFSVFRGQGSATARSSTSQVLFNVDGLHKQL